MLGNFFFLFDFKNTGSDINNPPILANLSVSASMWGLPFLIFAILITPLVFSYVSDIYGLVSMDNIYRFHFFKRGSGGHSLY